METETAEKQRTNLVFWQPGQSGNPHGRPKKTITQLLEKYLDLNDGERKRAIVKELHALAMSRGGRGQIPALIEILNRIDGKVADKTELTGQILIVTPDSLELAIRRTEELEQEKTKLLAESSESEQSV